MEDKPRANNKLSIILDLPEPFGPEIVVKPSNRGIVVAFPNDLKLSNSISFIRKSVYFPTASAALDYTLHLVSSVVVLKPVRELARLS